MPSTTLAPWFINLCDYAEMVAYCAMLIPIGMAWRNRHGLTGGLRPLAWLPVCLLFMYWMMQLGIYLWHYNLPIAHLSTIAESVLYLKIYHDVLNSSKQQIFIRRLIFIFLIFALVDSFLLEGFEKINSYTNLLESILVTVLIIAYFEEAIFTLKTTNLIRLPLFIASAGILVYLSGTVMIFLFTNHFIKNHDEFHTRLIYLISSFLVFILAMLLTRAFYLVKAPEPKLHVQKWR